MFKTRRETIKPLSYLAFLVIIQHNNVRRIEDDMSDGIRGMRYDLHVPVLFSSKMARKGFSATRNPNIVNGEDRLVKLSSFATGPVMPMAFECTLRCARTYQQLVSAVERAYVPVGFSGAAKKAVFATLHDMSSRSTPTGGILTLTNDFRVDVSASICFMKATPRCFLFIKTNSMTTLRVVFYYGDTWTFEIPRMETTPLVSWTKDGRYIYFSTLRLVLDLDRLALTRDRSKIKQEEMFSEHPPFITTMMSTNTIFSPEGPTFSKPLTVFQAMVTPLMEVVMSSPKMNKVMGWSIAIKKVNL